MNLHLLILENGVCPTTTQQHQIQIKNTKGTNHKIDPLQSEH